MTMNKLTIYSFFIALTAALFMPLQIQAEVLGNRSSLKTGLFWGNLGANIKEGSGGGGGTSVKVANTPDPFQCKGGYRFEKNPKYGTVTKKYC